MPDPSDGISPWPWGYARITGQPECELKAGQCKKALFDRIGAESVSVGQCIFHYRTALHHELHLLQHGDVGKRIALYGN